MYHFKPSELRVGSLIYRNGKIYDTTSYLITYLFEDPTRFNRHNQPIPITEEWLVKLGFLKDNERDSFYIDIEDGFHRFDLMWFNNGVFLKSRYNEENLGVQKIPYVQYLHQLQNLYFALTNEELTIK